MISIDENDIGRDIYAVRASDSDRFNSASIPFFFSAIQEMGGTHAGARGLSIEDMQKDHGWTWVITRSRIEFDFLPHWNDEVEMVTWPQKGYKLLCPRVVQGYVEGRKSFEAMTHWVILDIARKRPIRPSEIGDTLPPPPEDVCYRDPALEKLPKWDDEEKLELLEAYRPMPCYYDIDLNKHVNNVVYIRWITEALGEGFLDAFRVTMMDVQWISQTYSHDRIRVETAIIEKSDNKTRLIHRIMREEEGKEDAIVFEALSYWRKKDQ